MFYQEPLPPINPPKTVWNSHRLGWLGLATFEGFGSRTLKKLAKESENDGERAWAVGAATLQSFGCHRATIEEFDLFRKKTDLGALAKQLDQERISFILYIEESYPPLLRQITDPPFALFVRGTLESCSAPCIAIVGTRRNTTYGKRIASWISDSLARAGITIVSGLAGGIDTIAHEATLDANGSCIAVLGSGIDDATIYPRCNEKLAHRIIDAGGAIVSEFPPRTPGLRHHFPLRNRMISGLSRATVVVEAAEKSGSLITAHFALEQNRDVFSVPGPITNAQSQGANRLLAMGAIPCTSPDDILAYLKTTSNPLPRTPVTSLPKEDQHLLALLESPQHIDDIARSLKQPVHQVNAQLARLELKGFVTLTGPNLYGVMR